MPPASDVKIIDMRKFQEDESDNNNQEMENPSEIDSFLDDESEQEGGDQSISHDGTEEGFAEEGADMMKGGRSRRNKLKERLRQRRESSSSSSSSSSVASSTSTTRMLSSDPLFLVLYQYLVNNKGENIVTVLDKINKNLKKLVTLLDSDD